MAQPNRILDALALASMTEPALIKRVAALWCRAHANRAPYNRTEIERWVRAEFGPLLDAKRRERLGKELADETKRQIRLRLQRLKRAKLIDPLTLPQGDDVRIGNLLKSRLGPARAWVSQQRLAQQDPTCFYIDGDFFSGLVAGLIPIKMRLRRIIDPNLLVYRRGSSEPQSRFVPNYITTVADAFIWLIPDDAVEFLSIPGIRVEHDGEKQAVHLVTPWGTKLLPWKELSPAPTE